MDDLEHFLALLAGALELALEYISVLCVLVGLLKTGQFVFSHYRRSRNPDLSWAMIRLGFGRWLSLALEFQLAADIIITTVAPSFDALGKLAAIALIRTFLNFFLTKELAQETSLIDSSRASINAKETEQTNWER